jgi:hypothetical protein
MPRYRSAGQAWLSPRAFFVTLSLPFCPLEPLFFVAPSVSEGSPPLGRHPERSEGCLAIARQDRLGCRPEPFFVSPSHFFVSPSPIFSVAPSPIFCRPEALAEGSPPLGRCSERSEGCLAIARQDRLGCRPEPFFVTPRRQPRGLTPKAQSRTK